MAGRLKTRIRRRDQSEAVGFVKAVASSHTAIYTEDLGPGTWPSDCHDDFVLQDPICAAGSKLIASVQGLCPLPVADAAIRIEDSLQ